MADRVASGRIINGHGEGRIVIEPGERFDTDKLGLSDEEVAKMDANGILRLPRDPNTQAALPAGPAAETIEEPVPQPTAAPVKAKADEL